MKSGQECNTNPATGLLTAEGKVKLAVKAKQSKDAISSACVFFDVFAAALSTRVTLEALAVADTTTANGALRALEQHIAVTRDATDDESTVGSPPAMPQGVYDAQAQDGTGNMSMKSRKAQSEKQFGDLVSILLAQKEKQAGTTAVAVYIQCVLCIRFIVYQCCVILLLAFNCA